MFTFLLWCLLFVLCWPLALFAPGALSVRVAAALTFPAGGNCGARSLGTGVGSCDVAGETHNCAVPAASVGAGVLARAGQAKNSNYSTPFAGVANPNSFITICKSFQVSFF